MAIQLNPSNIFELISILSPLLLGFFLIMSSLFNQNLKGLVYLGGLLIAIVINIFLMNMLGSRRDETAAFSCDFVSIPFMSNFNSPAPSSLFIAFTIAYLVLPMNYNNQMNYMILASLLCLLVMDGITKVNKRCTTVGGSLIGALVGFMLGALWYTLFHISGLDSLLYFDELQSNRVVCNRPSKQSFKCSVYKNGELISSNMV